MGVIESTGEYYRGETNVESLKQRFEAQHIIMCTNNSTLCEFFKHSDSGLDKIEFKIDDSLPMSTVILKSKNSGEKVTSWSFDGVRTETNLVFDTSKSQSTILRKVIDTIYDSDNEEIIIKLAKRESAYFIS